MAGEELKEIPPGVNDQPEVLAVRIEIHRGLGQWGAMQTIAKHLVESDPGNPQWAISWAYATRRAESLESARSILMEAANQHPGEAIIPYNLACYECQLGNMDAAGSHLKTALKLQPKCREMALEDEDLKPLRGSLQGSSADQGC
jgi:predicted Zn-dependent protease